MKTLALTVLVLTSALSHSALAVEHKIFECSDRYYKQTVVGDKQNEYLTISYETLDNEVLYSSASEGDTPGGMNLYYVSGNSIDVRRARFNEYATWTTAGNVVTVSLSNKTHSQFTIKKVGDGPDCRIELGSDNADLLKSIHDQLNSSTLQN